MNKSVKLKVTPDSNGLVRIVGTLVKKVDALQKEIKSLVQSKIELDKRIYKLERLESKLYHYDILVREEDYDHTYIKTANGQIIASYDSDMNLIIEQDLEFNEQ